MHVLIKLIKILDACCQWYDKINENKFQSNPLGFPIKHSLNYIVFMTIYAMHQI
jgi:hypothetical protein